MAAAADRSAATAAANIDEALALMEEIDALEGRGSASLADFEFLKADPVALVAAISSRLRWTESRS